MTKSFVLFSLVLLALASLVAAGNINKKNSWNHQKKLGNLRGDDALFACFTGCDEAALPFVDAVTNTIEQQGAIGHRLCMIGCNNDYLVRDGKLVNNNTEAQPKRNRREARAPSKTGSVTPTSTRTPSETPSNTRTPAASLSVSTTPSPDPTIVCNMAYHIPQHFNRCGQDTFGRNAIGGCQWPGCLPSCISGGVYSGNDVCQKTGMLGCQALSTYCDDATDGPLSCLFQDLSERGFSGYACVASPCA